MVESKHGGRLGVRIAEQAHKEGRAAFKAGRMQRQNPYNGRSAKDSDEWLRYQGWRNGWMFAWYIAGCPRGR